MLFALGDLAIHDLASATDIIPEPESNQHHDTLALALFASSLAAIGLLFLGLALDGQPDAIELDHRRHIRDRLQLRLRHKGSDLIDALIERAQSHAASHCRTPPLANLAQTLAQTTTKKHILIQIQPEALELLQDREGTNYIMLTLLAFQHRHLQVFQMTPACFQIPAVMPIAGKLIGILTSAVSTLPINGTLCAAHLTRGPLCSSQLDCHLGFQELPQHGSNRL